MSNEKNGRVFHVTALVKDKCARADWLTARGVAGRYVPYAETEIGTAVHSIIAEHIRNYGLSFNGDLDQPDVVKMASMIGKVQTPELEDYVDIGEEFMSTVTVKAHLGLEALDKIAIDLDIDTVHEFAVEQNYKATVEHGGEEITISGTADLVIEYTGTDGELHVAVIDWKTGSSKQLSHKLQLEAYRQLIVESGSMADRMVLVYLGGDEADVVVFTSDDITKGRGKTKEVISVDIGDLALELANKYDEYRDLDIPPPCSVSFMCRYCKYNGVVCRGI